MTENIIAARYELLERLSEDLLFIAYRARDLHHGRVVLLKLLKPAFQNNRDLVDSLKQVFRMRASLKHPNVQTFLDLEEDNGQWFIIGEFTRGLDLKTRIHRTAPLTVPIMIEIALGMVEALDAGHRIGMVHGDLRPEHVAVSVDWHAWVDGFGFAPVYRTSPTLASARESLSVYYEAPEVLGGAPPSPASDFYAVGVIMFEMLTGNPPFVGDTPFAVAQEHRSQPIPSLRARNPNVSNAVEGIITRCLQKNPERRYQQAIQLLNDLKAVRDALRFGKPLNWTPEELPPEPLPSASPPKAEKTEVPVAAPIAPPIVETVTAAVSPQETRPPAQPQPSKAKIQPAFVDEEDPSNDLPGWLRFLLRAMMTVILLAILVGGAFWLAVQFAPNERAVPDLVGKSLTEARKLSGEQSLQLEVKREDYNEQFEPGTVFLMTPTAGKMVKEGTKVEVWVSLGTRFVVVPDVRNQPESRARRALTDAGLTIMDETRERFSDTIPFGFVIGTVPQSKTRIERSKPIQLIVSKGQSGDPGRFTDDDFSSESRLTPEPKPEGPLRAFGIKVDLTDQYGMRQVRIEVTDSMGTRDVVNESQPGGASYEYEVEAQGKRVTIRVFVDDEKVQELSR